MGSKTANAYAQCRKWELHLMVALTVAGWSSQKCSNEPNPAAKPNLPQQGSATAQGIQQLAQKAANARNEAQPEWLKGLFTTLLAQVKSAETTTS